MEDFNWLDLIVLIRRVSSCDVVDFDVVVNLRLVIIGLGLINGKKIFGVKKVEKVENICSVR